MDLNIFVWMERVEGGAALRTPTVEGFTDVLPEVGRTFMLIGRPLNAMAQARLVETSVVTEVEKSEGRWGEPISTFKTQSGSKYRVTVRPPPQE